MYTNQLEYRLYISNQLRVYINDKTQRLSFEKYIQENYIKGKLKKGKILILILILCMYGYQEIIQETKWQKK